MTSPARLLGAVAAAFVLVGGAGLRASWLVDDEVPGPVRAPLAPPSEVARDATRFLETYVEPDGRVVRRDEGGDTVSEGQAYALLVAVAVGDEVTFDRVWRWTEAHLQRPDGLLAWRWADGAVVDEQAAADADLDTAWALALAARRWPLDGYAEAAHQIATAVGQHETAALRDGALILAPGPWAVAAARAGDPLVVNPSYASPVAEAVLADGGAIAPSTATARSSGSRLVVAQLLADRGVPTDWARVTDGEIAPADGPADAGRGRFGWDAVRVPLRLAASCDAADRDLAARVWEAMEAGAGVDALGDHPARLAGAAAAAAAAGESTRAEELLDEASAAEARAPTYYGSALTALARLLLASDRLGSCPPLARR